MQPQHDVPFGSRRCGFLEPSVLVAGEERAVLSGSGRHDQVNKGKRWMSWRREAMKDVGTCDKPCGAGNQAVMQGSPNVETRLF
jgi:hypothetical protein